MPDTTIPDNALHSFVDALDKANVRTAERYPGDSPARQPVHTVYGGAHLFKMDAVQKIGAVALKALQDHAPDGATLARALDLSPALGDRVYLRVVDKLTREPVEDYRIDFEDGFGTRPDDEEDAFAKSTADEVAIRPESRLAAARHRHPHQAAERRAETPQPENVRPVPDEAAREDRWGASNQFRDHTAQDHLR